MSLRAKLITAFCGPLLILIIVGLMSVSTVDEASSALQRILRENYDSVAAAYRMVNLVEDLDHITQGVILNGLPTTDLPTAPLIAEFDRALKFQQGNITLRGEKEVTDQIAESWRLYRQDLERLFGPFTSGGERLDFYRKTVLAHSAAVRKAAQTIIRINLDNMVSADGQARLRANETRKTMILLVLSGAALTAIFIAVTGSMLLRPLARLTASVREIRNGNLDLVVNSRSHDEIGQLAEAVNEMARGLREFRRSGQARLLRTQQSTQLAMNSLSDAVAVCNQTGEIELVNDAARRLFGLEPGANISSTGNDLIIDVFTRAERELRRIRPKGYRSAIQVFVDGKESFFLPEAIPILDDNHQLIGITVVLLDVTDNRKLDEAKSDMISTVSHELKTPLTSFRLSAHVLLSEKVGPLTPKQVELLDTARKDSDRLYEIIESLLDMGRMEAGKTALGLETIVTDQLTAEATEGLRPAFIDAGVTLTV
ncbi:MAG: histidine kinase dimerization/phospho-acceptor domain-containing protein, partial [Acidobacteriota bacterium]